MNNDSIHLNKYIARFNNLFVSQKEKFPWTITRQMQEIILGEIKNLGEEFIINEGVAIHKTAIIEHGVTLKGPIIVGANCFIAAHTYLRGGVFLDKNVSIGPGCEIKSSIIFSNSSMAHFNFVGDSLIGSFVNMEAGSIIANHYNERDEKQISVLVDTAPIATDATKFGALVGDHTKIGANAVLSPGTILPPKSVVNRLELIRQI
jgi:UDP-N-acetylglucosamine diphosphorylase / glucose-1-phosphate thymidylyltransferase / UDP-N-acetylgalactosamine diphosphorylase / glucosamine-1-phosphate N-acetyltransferase / galactosamine-1-phosphate N-acetyltransferase